MNEYCEYYLLLSTLANKFYLFKENQLLEHGIYYIYNSVTSSTFIIRYRFIWTVCSLSSIYLAIFILLNLTISLLLSRPGWPGTYYTTILYKKFIIFLPLICVCAATTPRFVFSSLEYIPRSRIVYIVSVLRDLRHKFGLG